MIFISHRQADEKKALAIKNYLTERNVPSYIDVLDAAVRMPTDITKHIMTQLRKCSHIIVVFTSNTQGSMWVPFEIGAAYEANIGIGTYYWAHPKLPEYLHAFPLMKTRQHLDNYIAEYKTDKRLIETTVRTAARTSDAFNDRLMRKLDQI